MIALGLKKGVATHKSRHLFSCLKVLGVLVALKLYA